MTEEEAKRTVLEQMHEIAELKREVERLRAALMPVIACDVDFDVGGAVEEGDVDLLSGPYDAVREAQKAYNDGIDKTE